MSSVLSQKIKQFSAFRLCIFLSQHLYICCRKEDPFQGLKLGSCLILRNELSKDTHVLTKQEILLGKGTWVESSRAREPRRTALPVACGFWFYGDGISFRVVFSQLFWLRVLPGGVHLVQPRWMPEGRILGGGRTCGISFWPFLKVMASGPITSWQIDGETMQTVSDFILGGSKITADGDCSHEILKDAYSLEGKLWPT